MNRDTAYPVTVKARGDGTTYSTTWGSSRTDTANTDRCVPDTTRPQLPTPEFTVTLRTEIRREGTRLIFHGVPEGWRPDILDHFNMMIEVKSANVDPQDFKYRLDINPLGTGFVTVHEHGGCTSGLKPGNLEFNVDADGQAFFFVSRCSMGVNGNIGWTLHATRNADSRTFQHKVLRTIDQAHHSSDGIVRYSVNKDDKFTRSLTSDQQELMRRGTLWGVALWEHGGASVDFVEDPDHANLLTIRGYARTLDRDDDEGCTYPRALGCVKNVNHDLPEQHITTQELWIPFPPLPSSEGPSEWEMDYLLAATNRTLRHWITPIIMHELGHTAGLGHSAHGMGTMSPAYDPLNEVPYPSPSAEDRYGMERVLSTHTHP